MSASGSNPQPPRSDADRVVPTSLDALIERDNAQGVIAPDSDCVVSSRVRLARNLIGYPFVHRATPDQLNDLVHRVQSARMSGPFQAGVRWVNVQATAAIDRLLLFERNLISRPFVESPHPRCVAISSDETTSVMVNEEDHLRLQMLAPGLQLQPLASRMFALDASLERSLEFSFHPRFGYLTACPTNVGTGIRVSAMLHLPALIMLDEIDRMKRAAKDMHLAVRGFHGEGTEAVGDFFQVSNQTTLGRSEIDLVEEFTLSIVPQFVAYERTARQTLVERDPASLDDRVFRALGILRSCRLLALEESLKFLSRIRLGVALGRVSDVTLAQVDRLLVEVQPAHLARSMGHELNTAQDEELAKDAIPHTGKNRDDRAARATMVRASLNA